MRILLWYAVTRLAGLAPLIFPEAVLLREPTKWLLDLDRLGPSVALPEYPWLAVQLMQLPLWLGIPTVLHYYGAVIAFLLAVDGAVTCMLWRASGGRSSRGLWLWLLFFPALGPLTVTRFDVVPAALAAAALLALSRARPGTAGTLAAVGAGLKVWPALGLPALLLPDVAGSRQRVLLGFGAVAAVLVVATAVAGGPGRIWSPLALQAERGLQIEAFAALPFLWLRLLSSHPAWVIQGNPLCNCHELVGPGIGKAVAIAGFAAFAAAGGVLALYIRAFFADRQVRSASLAAVLTALMLIVWLVTARVFSPQYMIWLAAPMAVLGVLPENSLPRSELILYILACLLTHLDFPLNYEALLSERHVLQGLALAILTLRDMLIVVLGLLLALKAWRATAPDAAKHR